ncbi:MAG: hypothetical protein DRG50_08975, partial [Deltaproteobacteria bacterium]
MFNFFYQIEARGKKKTKDIYTLENLIVTLWPLPEYIARTTQGIDINNIPVPVTFEGYANKYTQIKIDKIIVLKADARHQFPEQYEILPSQLEGVTDTANRGGTGYNCTYRFPPNFEVFPNFEITLSLRIAPDKVLGCNKTFYWQPFRKASGPSLGNWENEWEGAVVGYVYDAETRKPLADFPVQAQVPVLNKYSSARTDSNGRYQIPIDLHELKKDCIGDLHVHAGEYREQGDTTQGYKEQGKAHLTICKGKITPYVFYLEPAGTQEGQVPPSTDLYIKDIVIVPENPSISEKATVRVIVGNKSGTPADNVQVQLLYQDSPAGNLRFRKLPGKTEEIVPFDVIIKSLKHNRFEAQISSDTKDQNSADNNLLKTFDFFHSNLVIKECRLAHNSQAIGNRPVAIEVVVKNTGDADARDVEVIRGTDTTGMQVIPLIKGGESKKVTFRFTMPPTSGNVSFTFRVDPNDKIKETDENDNARHLEIYVEPSGFDWEDTEIVTTPPQPS